MCFLSPTTVFLVITLQVGQATSPFSLISRCHWSSGFAGEGEERREVLHPAVETTARRAAGQRTALS